MNEEINDLLKQYIYIPIGLPCCGKSTFFKAMRDDNNFFPVQLASPDKMREEYYPGYEAGEIPFDKIDQGMIFLKAERKMEDHLIDGFDVWFDATNLHYKSRLVLYHRGEAINLKPMHPRIMHYVLIKMTTPLEIIKQRQKCRKGHRRPSDEILERFQEQFDAETNNNLHFPERSEVWDLEWNEEWKIHNEVPEKCRILVENINKQF
jgi:predicted kinase